MSEVPPDTWTPSIIEHLLEILQAFRCRDVGDLLLSAEETPNCPYTIPLKHDHPIAYTTLSSW